MHTASNAGWQGSQAWWCLAYGVVWMLWASYWWLASFGAKRTLRHEGLLSRLAHIGPLGLATWMIAVPHLPGHVLEQRWLPQTAWLPPLGLVVQVAGLGFSVWARRVLGRNWSGTVTVKDGHELIRTGPYRRVRHPIYTGMLAGYLGCAIVLGQWRGVLAVLLVTAGFWRKLQLEERWMTETFGEAYRDYRQRTAALIPGLM